MNSILIQNQIIILDNVTLVTIPGDNKRTITFYFDKDNTRNYLFDTSQLAAKALKDIANLLNTSSRGNILMKI